MGEHRTLGEWQPINKAPVNTNILVWDSRRKMALLAFFAVGGKQWLDPFDANHQITPSHWMPLPEPPK